MITMKSTYKGPAFTAGDEVIMVRGSYQGTPGVFLHLNVDLNWADIRERNGAIRNHPLAWMVHVKPSPIRASASK